MNVFILLLTAECTNFASLIYSYTITHGTIIECIFCSRNLLPTRYSKTEIKRKSVTKR